MVRFRYPDKHTRTGKVEKQTEPILVGEDYRVAVELVSLDGKPEKYIRFAYWRKRTSKRGKPFWGWASQTTWTFSVDVTKRAIRMAEELGFFD
jgi:hypothetical protein